MYNLFVSGNADSWESDVYEIELSRCVREYTEDEITAKYGDLRDQEVAALARLPCIFAYESGIKKNPKFGLIEEVQRRPGSMVRLRYKIMDVGRFLTHEELDALSLELDIRRWELGRTHWAVKDVNLARELHSKLGIKLPDWAGNTSRTIDVTKHNFDVGLSFPGESRDYVEEVARELEGFLGPHRYFYDNNYVAQLARPSLDQLLQNIYRKQCDLIVVFLSGAYENKEWCGLEFRIVSEIILERAHQRVMYIKMDDEKVTGVLKTDGYVDGRKYSPKQIAAFIGERVTVLHNP